MPAAPALSTPMTHPAVRPRSAASPPPEAPRDATASSSAAPTATQLQGFNESRALIAVPARVAAEAAVASSGAGAALERAQRFRHAAEVGDLAQLEILLPGQPDINARDPLGRTALMIAVLRGQTAAVSALLAYGADPNAVDLSGRTPLQVARGAGADAITAMLERYGAH
jgi:hypothetical protein